MIRFADCQIAAFKMFVFGFEGSFLEKN